jgi:hypothetical protein
MSHERSECKPDAKRNSAQPQDAKRKRDSAQPQDAKRKRDSAQPQERAQPSIDDRIRQPEHGGASPARHR